MPRTQIYDGPDCTVYEDTSAGWPDAQGSTRTVRTVWKPGSVGATQVARDANAATFRADMTGQIGALRKIAYPGKYGATALTQAQQNALFARVLLSLARMVVAQADPTALDATDA